MFYFFCAKYIKLLFESTDENAKIASIHQWTWKNVLTCHNASCYANLRKE